jgi:hypothetical protein
MSDMNLMRVPGLGLAATLPAGLTTEPRFDRCGDRAVEPQSTLDRLIERFRPTAPERLGMAPSECLPASSPGRPLARA